MNNELRWEMTNILEALATHPDRMLVVSRPEASATQINAAIALHAAGYLAETGNATAQLHGAAITLRGFEYLEELSSPRKKWVKRNWFAVVVALITASTALADIAVRLSQGNSTMTP